MTPLGHLCLKQNTPLNFASFDDLPDELVLSIVEYADHKSRKAISSFNDRHIRYFGRFSLVYVLSQVNRRLRAIARPFVRIDLQCDDYDGLMKTLDKLERGDHGHYELVRYALQSSRAVKDIDGLNITV